MKSIAIVCALALVSHAVAVPMFPADMQVALQEAESVGCFPTGVFQMACSQWLANAADDVPGECTNTCYTELGKLVASGCSVAVRGVFTPYHEKCHASLPTPAPTSNPTEEPTHVPTHTPTEVPTTLPPTTTDPSYEPTHTPTEEPTAEPTVTPTEEPTEEPTAEPTREPTEEPTSFPTVVPTAEPTADPTEEPTAEPTAVPTEIPTAEPTADPTEVPTTLPPTTDEPTFAPTEVPTEPPTHIPTSTPTEKPTHVPTHAPTENPTHVPTQKPTAPACDKLLKSDVVIAVDTSASITDDQWTQFMSFLDKLTADFPVKEDGMHMGLMQFATVAHTYQGLTGTHDPESKKNMKPKGTDTEAGQMGRHTNMHLAVDTALDMFTKGREKVTDVLLVITDGLPTGGTAAGSPADKGFLKAKKNGVQVIFVTIGWLFQFVPLPDSWMSGKPIKINDFGGLEAVRGQIVTMLCKTVEEAPEPLKGPKPQEDSEPVTPMPVITLPKPPTKPPATAAPKPKRHTKAPAKPKPVPVKPVDPCKKWEAENRANAAVAEALKAEVRFGGGKTAITTSGKKTLNSVAKILKQYPWMSIDVEAHSDARSGARCAMLTKGRAANAERYLRLKGVKNPMGKPRGRCATKRAIVIANADGNKPAPKGCKGYQKPAPVHMCSAMVVIGNQRNSRYKSKAVPAGYKCPARVSKSNWANNGRHKRAQDIFQVTVSGGKVTVRRDDKAGLNGHG